MDLKVPQVIECRHCGNRTPHVVVHTVTTNGPIVDDNGEEIGCAESHYFLAQCQTCDECSLYANWEHDESPNRLSSSVLLYPAEKAVADSVPKGIAESYKEARKVRKISPQSFAVLIGRALEHVCEDQKASKGNLGARIEYLAKHQIIPDTLAKMADIIRLLRNISAHDFTEKITPGDAENLDDFFTTPIEYIYVAPHKIRKLQERLVKKGEAAKKDHASASAE